MKAKTFLTELEQIRHWLEDQEDDLEEDYYEYLGFYPGIGTEITATAFQRGYWSTFIFAYDDDISFGLRIMPNTPAEDWPVVKIRKTVQESLLAIHSKHLSHFNWQQLYWTKICLSRLIKTGTLSWG